MEGILFSRCLSVCLCVRPSITFCFLNILLYPPKTLSVEDIMFSHCPSVCPSFRNVLFPEYLEESSIIISCSWPWEFHQTLQTHLCIQDKYFKQKSKGYGQILLELFPFVVLNGFLYRGLCLCYYSPNTGRSTPTTALNGAIWYFAYTM